MDSGDFELRVGHRFAQPELLRRALTHRSHSATNNERLEFLGDSVVNCAIALELYHKFPQLSEGELSRLRASLVNQQSLAGVAQQFDFGSQLLLGEGEARSGGSRRPSILADAVEAVIGAAFLDGGFEAAHRVVRALLGSAIDAIDPATSGKDPKTLLQEYLQGRRIALPQYPHRA
jgi:ribonuclease-3